MVRTAISIGAIYIADAYELMAERAAVGTPCAKCGKPLPVDLLCECETYEEPTDEPDPMGPYGPDNYTWVGPIRESDAEGDDQEPPEET